jgi:hypothetical protein
MLSAVSLQENQITMPLSYPFREVQRLELARVRSAGCFLMQKEKTSAVNGTETISKAKQTQSVNSKQPIHPLQTISTYSIHRILGFPRFPSFLQEKQCNKRQER